MKLTAVALALNAAAERLGVHASAVADGVSAAVSVAAIQLAYRLGDFLKIVRITDKAQSLDAIALTFFKTQTEDLALADRVSRQFVKNLREDAGLTDRQVLTFFKGIHEQTQASDRLAFIVAKSPVDRGRALDRLVFGLTKGSSDAAAAIDARMLTLFKPAADGFGVTDSTFRRIEKGLRETGVFADFSSRVVAKQLLDQISVTDDLDGAASIQDDQEIQFFKSTSEVAHVIDSIRIACIYSRFFNEVAQIADLAAKQFSKQLIDAGSASDSRMLTLGKGIAESGLAGDLVTKTSTKASAETAQVVDTRVFSTLSSKTDMARITDTGSLRSQGYCDFTYFAEDFVGSSRSF